MYDAKRGSKIYMKGLASSRTQDAEELFWVDALQQEEEQGVRSRRQR